jgi:TusA-related sulfurtransferase
MSGIAPAYPAARLVSVDEPVGADEELDVRGMGCAAVLIELARVWRNHSEPWVVVVRTDDGGAPEELPSWCRMTHSTFVGLISTDASSSHYQVILHPPITKQTEPS